MFKLNKDWANILDGEFEKNYYKDLTNFLKIEYENKDIYPAKENVFSALNFVSFKDVKIVIIGQDPYHQKGQAHGLSFSVRKGVKTPPSLRNIYKELNTDLGCFIPNNGNLKKWAKQGVLLLNAVLTVEDSSPNSHKKKGWMTFTSEVIKKLSERSEPIVFLLWGNNAKFFKKVIDENKHFILTSAHPSPLSVYNGFFGCSHFSQANELLTKLKKNPIDWQIDNIDF
jgi:uracil-DNA glycosylase